jgi:hypothetical protein
MLVQAKLESVGATTLLEDYMAQPDVYESVLADTLREAGADQDGELIDAAQSFMDTAEPGKAIRGGHTVDIDDDGESDRFV